MIIPKMECKLFKIPFTCTRLYPNFGNCQYCIIYDINKSKRKMYINYGELNVNC